MTLNDETFVECAIALAGRLASRDTSVEDAIRFGFTLTTCREPTASEVERLVHLHQTAGQESNWLSVATVLLNLDEVLTK